MKYTIELVRTVEFIVEAPSEEVAEKVASDCLEDEILWDGAAQDAYVHSYSGRNGADFEVNEDGEVIS